MRYFRFAPLLAVLWLTGCGSPDTKDNNRTVAEADSDKHNPSAAESPVKKDSPKEDTPAPQPPRKTESGGNKDKNAVVAEGVGTTSDDALKDAFRNAVRQVVGAVVDSETLLKNDRIVADKVLTYSDGFVTSYEEISKTAEKGLFRTTIQASVERRSLIAKLKAANIAVKDVDGKGIFAEVITQIDAEKNAEKLIEAALVGFPKNVLEATVVAKPQIIERNERSVKLGIRVQFKANVDAYNSFAARFENALKSVAKQSGSFSMSVRNQGKGLDGTDFFSPDREGKTGVPPPATGDALWKKLMPDVFSWERDLGPGTHVEAAKGQVVVAICKQWPKTPENTQWAYFAVDDSVRRPLIECSGRRLQLSLSLLSQDESVIVAQQSPTKTLSHQNAQRFTEITAICPAHSRRPQQKTDGAGDNFTRSDIRHESLFLVSPLFIELVGSSVRPAGYDLRPGQPAPGSGIVCFYYSPVIEMPVEFSLTLAQIKSIHSIKCELTN
jgi:hypothetical protein